MNRKPVVILIGLLLIFGMAITLSAIKTHKIKFENKSKITVTYFLYRIDHHLPNIDKPISFAVGTLKSGKHWTVNAEEGLYFVEWYYNNKKISETETFKLDQDTSFTVGPFKEKKYAISKGSHKST